MLMGLFARFLKLKAYWGLLTGLFTLVIIPLTRWLLKNNKTSGASKSKVVDAEFEEINRTDGRS